MDMTQTIAAFEAAMDTSKFKAWLETQDPNQRCLYQDGSGYFGVGCPIYQYLKDTVPLPEGYGFSVGVFKVQLRAGVNLFEITEEIHSVNIPAMMNMAAMEPARTKHLTGQFETLGGVLKKLTALDKDVFLMSAEEREKEVRKGLIALTGTLAHG